MRVAATYLRRWYSVETELVLVALVLLGCHALRIPIEGDVATSLARARDVLRVERALSLDVEQEVIGRLDEANVTPALEWLYTNIHVPVPYAFVAAARLLAPERSPSSARRSRRPSFPRRSSSGSIRLPLRTCAPSSASVCRRPTPS